jgi:hypothetical protein
MAVEPGNAFKAVKVLAIDGVKELVEPSLTLGSKSPDMENSRLSRKWK